MSKRKQNTITVFIIIALLTVAVIFIVPAMQSASKEIPFGQEFNGAEDLAEQLGVSAEMFEAYLASIDSDYDRFVAHLNEIQMTPEQLADDTLRSTGYTFADYTQVITLISGATSPDERIYDKIATGGTLLSETADIDVYISKISRQNLEKHNIRMFPTTSGTDESVKLFHLFALLTYVNGDIPTFISSANDVFGCESVEITNINVYGNYGVERPDNQNKMIDELFNVKSGTNEIYKAIPMPVLTLRFTDENQNISFGVIEPAGLIFIADSVDALKNMNRTEFFDMLVRQTYGFSNDHKE